MSDLLSSIAHWVYQLTSQAPEDLAPELYGDLSRAVQAAESGAGSLEAAVPAMRNFSQFLWDRKHLDLTTAPVWEVHKFWRNRFALFEPIPASPRDRQDEFSKAMRLFENSWKILAESLKRAAATVQKDPTLKQSDAAVYKDSEQILRKRFAFKAQVVGSGFLKPGGQYIFAATHHTPTEDSRALIAALGDRYRLRTIFADDYGEEGQPVAKLLRLTGNFILHPELPGFTIMQAARYLQAHSDVSVIIHPWGVLQKGETQPPVKDGAGVLSVLSGLEVVPVRLEGMEVLQNAQADLEHPLRPVIRLGRPIPPADWEGKKPVQESVKAISRQITDFFKAADPGAEVNPVSGAASLLQGVMMAVGLSLVPALAQANDGMEGQGMETWQIAAIGIAIIAGAIFLRQVRKIYRNYQAAAPRRHFVKWDPAAAPSPEERILLQDLQALWGDRNRKSLSARELLPLFLQLRGDLGRIADWLVQRLKDGPKAKHADYFPAHEAAHALSGMAAGLPPISKRPEVLKVLFDWMGREQLSPAGTADLVSDLGPMTQELSEAHLHALLGQLNGLFESASKGNIHAISMAMAVIASKFPTLEQRADAVSRILKWVNHPNEMIWRAAAEAAQRVAGSLVNPTDQVHFTLRIFDAFADKRRGRQIAGNGSVLADLLDLAADSRDGSGLDELRAKVNARAKPDIFVFLRHARPSVRRLAVHAYLKAVPNQKNDREKFRLLNALIPWLADPSMDVFERVCAEFGQSLKFLPLGLAKQLLRTVENRTDIDKSRLKTIANDIFRTNRALLSVSQKQWVGYRLEDNVLLEEGISEAIQEKSPYSVIGWQPGGVDGNKPQGSGALSPMGRVSQALLIGDFTGARSNQNPQFLVPSYYSEEAAQVSGLALKREANPAVFGEFSRKTRRARILSVRSRRACHSSRSRPARASASRTSRLQRRAVSVRTRSLIVRH